MLIIENIMHSANFIVYKFLVQLSCVLRKKKGKMFPQHAPYEKYWKLLPATLIKASGTACFSICKQK